MKAIVDDGFFSSAFGIVRNHFWDLIAAVLGCERDDGGCSTKGSGDGRAIKVVGTHHAHA